MVRSSKYRHVYGDPIKKNNCIDNIRLTQNAFDANLAKSNGKYVSLNWASSGGGSFAVIPLTEQQKLPDRFPLFDGHHGPVLDTDWNPFDDEMVVSASEDSTIGIWRVPEKFSVHVDFGPDLDDCPDVKPVKFISGHAKKVGHVNFNPVAKDVLASASLDNTIKVWNIESGECLFTLPHPSFVTNFCWNYDGTRIATVAKDRMLRVWDVRAEKLISEGKGHAGAKGSRVCWLGDRDRILTTGFSLVSDREMAIWDASDIAKGPIGGFHGIDSSSGIVIPHYDPMTSMVYLGGRGDGKIVYYEYENDNLHSLFAYNSTAPQRGLGWVPNRSLDPHEREVARVYKVHEQLIEQISFKVPLKHEGFLDSVYTVTESTKPALTAEEWKNGKTSRPLVVLWEDIYEKRETKPIVAPKTEEAQKEAPKKEEPKKETKKEELKKEVSKKEEPKKEEPKKEAPKKEESKKEEPKKEELKIDALKKAEKQDSYDVLNSDNVKSFLAKNKQDDKEEPEESVWDEPESKVNEEKEKQKAEKAKADKEKADKDKAEKEKADKAKAEKANAEKEKDAKPASTSSTSSAVSSVSSQLALILKKLDELSARIENLERK